MSEKQKPFEPMTDKYIDDWVKDIGSDHYSPMPDDPDVLAVAAQAKEANALRLEVEKMKEVCEVAKLKRHTHEYLCEASTDSTAKCYCGAFKLSEALAKLKESKP